MVLVRHLARDLAEAVLKIFPDPIAIRPSVPRSLCSTCFGPNVKYKNEAQRASDPGEKRIQIENEQIEERNYFKKKKIEERNESRERTKSPVREREYRALY